MDDFPRKADGRRIFTAEFKRGVVQQILKGEKTLAEVSRELDIQPTVIRQWKRFHTRCPFVFARCRIEKPELRELAAGHRAACHLY